MGDNYEYKKRSTNIDEVVRNHFSITRDEYALCAYVEFRLADPRMKKAGWCTDSKAEVAGFIGITRPGLYKMIDRLVAVKILEVDAISGYIRVTSTWIDAVGEGKTKQNASNKSVNLVYTSKKDNVNLVNTACKLSLHDNVNLVTGNIEVQLDSKLDKVDFKKEEEENPKVVITTLNTKKENTPPIAPLPPRIAISRPAAKKRSGKMGN